MQFRSSLENKLYALGDFLFLGPIERILKGKEEFDPRASIRRFIWVYTLSMLFAITLIELSTNLKVLGAIAVALALPLYGAREAVKYVAWRQKNEGWC